MQLPAWTFTFLVDDENCPAKAWHKHVAKDLPKEAKSPEQTWGIDVHKAFEYRLKEKRPMPASMPWERFALAIEQAPGQVYAEEWLQMTADGSEAKPFAPDIWGRGRVDVAVLMDTTAVLFDWKTGKPREEPLELETQALLLKVKFPNLQHVRGHYVWLKENRLGKVHDLSNFARTMNDVRLRWKDISSRNIDSEWPRNPNPLCGWCPVKTCPHNRSAQNG